MKSIDTAALRVHQARPEWLKVKVPSGEHFTRIKGIVDANKLHTVCEDARCPNMAECWHRGTATFMILGDICTRSCAFCAVKTGRPSELDYDEPRRVAEAVQQMHIRHAVVTSVNRDELEDGGAEIFAQTIRKIREYVPHCTVEVLIPDFRGDEQAIQIVVDAKPDILNHNTETVPRLYAPARPQAKYDRSLHVLAYSKAHGMTTKTGLMLGIGERVEEIEQTLRDIRSVHVDILTLGQYLQPTKMHLPVDRFVTPEEFSHWKNFGLSIGFKHVESGPLVRSSYHAEEQI